jgi:subtilisin
MKTSFLIKMTTLIMGLFLCLPLTAIAKDKSVIVGFYEKPGHLEKALIHEAKGIIKRTYSLIPAMAVTISDVDIEKIKNNIKVAYVEDDAVYMAVEPLIGDEYINSWGVSRIFADVAHASGNKGAGVRVAVLDTGIDDTHPDIDDNFKGGYDFVFNDNAPFDDSWNSHGTHIAGTIAAEENGIGVIGVVPEADLYAVKVLDGGGFGLLSWIIAGIEWAVLNGMDIVNMSFEGLGSQALLDTCDSAYSAGVLLVAAGGNTYGGMVQYPAAYDSVIAVTGTDADDMKATFSPIGPEVELAAPGVDVLSTCSLTNNDCVGGYRFLSGTSQASPHVAGTAALLFSSPDLLDFDGNGVINNVDVRLLLQDTAIDLGDPGQDNVFGFGLVNAAGADLPIKWPLKFTVTRTSGSAADDAEIVSLSQGLFEIEIKNEDLEKVIVEVFENDVKQKKLSRSYNFNQSPKKIKFNLDATGTSYDVIFTPEGITGASAEIEIEIDFQ